MGCASNITWQSAWVGVWRRMRYVSVWLSLSHCSPEIIVTTLLICLYSGTKEKVVLELN